MKRSTAVTALVVVALSLTACAPQAADDPTTSPTAGGAAVSTPTASAGTQALPPTVVSPGDLGGATVAVVIGTSLVVAVPDGSESEWRGTTADPAIAEFSAGGPSEGAVFRPGYIARSTGTTAATLTGTDGHTIEFTISVIAP